MFEQFFSFKENPFNLTPDTEYLFPSSVHKEALAHLVYATKQKKGFSVLTGEIGTGKTTLCRALLKQLPEDTQVAHILSSRLTCEELFRSILVDLGVVVDAALDKVQLIHKLHEFLVNQLAEGHSVIVIIDEAQNLEVSVLEELRMISNLETEKEKLVQIILVGQPELRQLLNQPQLRQFRQRISVRYHLGPMTREDTEKYILHRIRVASREDVNISFTREAFYDIYFATQGIPRLVNIVCESILLSAYVVEKNTIDENLVKDVLKELAQDEILPSKPVDIEDNYRHYYHLKEDPFHFSPRLDYAYHDSPVVQLVHEIQNVISHQTGPLVITGEPGSGKTFFCQLLKQELSKHVQVCYLEEPQQSIADFEERIYKGFQLTSELKSNRSDKSDQNLMWELCQFFISKSDNRQTPVLIIDNADKLSLQCAQDLGLWINFMESESANNGLLQFILVGTPLIEEKIRVMEDISKENELFNHYKIKLLSSDQVASYVNHRLEIAGATREFIQFTPDALYSIASISEGNPKMIHKICSQVLVKSFGQKLRIIDHRVIHQENLHQDSESFPIPRVQNIMVGKG